jgi:hypothetical protein
MNNQNHMEGYVSIEGIDTLEQLIDKIKEEVSPAFEVFGKEYKLPVANPRIDVQELNNGQSNSLYLRPKKIPKQKLGTVGNCIERADLRFFSGKRIESIMYQGKLWFNPFVWVTLDIKFSLKNHGGENGMPFYVGKGSSESTSIYYDIIEAEFYTETEKQDVVRERAREEKKIREEAEKAERLKAEE